MSLRPQTLYAIADSPVGLAAWILDHDARSYSLIARVFDKQQEGLSRDDILDNITMYWLTNTAVSSARLYSDTTQTATSGFFDPRNVRIPVAVTVCPDEIYAAPRSWAERAYPKLIYFNKLPKGGHFAAWEQPELFVREMRMGLRITADIAARVVEPGRTRGKRRGRAPNEGPPPSVPGGQGRVIPKYRSIPSVIE
jgi:pimeloyl-ACP methyl ester carboxylesterase